MVSLHPDNTRPLADLPPAARPTTAPTDLPTRPYLISKIKTLIISDLIWLLNYPPQTTPTPPIPHDPHPPFRP